MIDLLLLFKCLRGWKLSRCCRIARRSAHAGPLIQHLMSAHGAIFMSLGFTMLCQQSCGVEWPPFNVGAKSVVPTRGTCCDSRVRHASKTSAKLLKTRLCWSFLLLTSFYDVGDATVANDTGGLVQPTAMGNALPNNATMFRSLTHNI